MVCSGRLAGACNAAQPSVYWQSNGKKCRVGMSFAVNSDRTLYGTTCIQSEDSALPLQLLIPIVARTTDGAQKLLQLIEARGQEAEELAAPLKMCAPLPSLLPHRILPQS